MKVAADRAEGPVMVVLDSDHRREHAAAELELYGPLVTSGSLMLAQDAIVDAHRIFTEGRPGPGPAIAEFLARHHELYVDESRDRRFLATHHPRGWLRRR
jgi:cephalosporin hydroxylase